MIADQAAHVRARAAVDVQAQRGICARVEHAIERVFFHKWQVNEAALKRFVVNVSYRTTEDDLSRFLHSDEHLKILVLASPTKMFWNSCHLI